MGPRNFGRGDSAIGKRLWIGGQFNLYAGGGRRGRW